MARWVPRKDGKKRGFLVCRRVAVAPHLSYALRCRRDSYAAYARARGCIMSMTALAAAAVRPRSGEEEEEEQEEEDDEDHPVLCVCASPNSPPSPSPPPVWLVCWLLCADKKDILVGRWTRWSARGSANATQKLNKKKRRVLSGRRVADAPHPSYALRWKWDGYAA